MAQPHRKREREGEGEGEREGEGEGESGASSLAWELAGHFWPSLITADSSEVLDLHVKGGGVAQRDAGCGRHVVVIRDASTPPRPVFH